MAIVRRGRKAEIGLEKFQNGTKSGREMTKSLQWSGRWLAVEERVRLKRSQN